MSIVDAHTHMPGRAFSMVGGFEPGDFLALMDASGVDKAWVFTLMDCTRTQAPTTICSKVTVRQTQIA